MINEKYYTRSNGEKVKLSDMNSEHILNALGKKQRDLFNCKNKDEFSESLKVVNDLKEEYHTRLNKFYETLGEGE